MDQSASGLEISTVNTVETPVGTPSPPNAASTVARPPPRPRRLPHINFLEDEVECMVKNLSVSFTKKHEDTPHPSPVVNEVPSPELQSPISQDDSTETVVPAYGLHPKYLVPTPGGPRLAQEPNMGLSCFFDSTILEDIEPPSGIFLLEMTRKDDLKEQEFEILAQEQNVEFEEIPLDLDEEEASFKSGGYRDLDEVEDDFYALAKQQEFEMKTKDHPEHVEFGQGTIEDEPEEADIESESETIENEPPGSENSQENSMSDYFKLKTSNLGNSPGDLDFSAKLNLSRPNFGLEELNSPKPKPVAMITPADILKHTVELSESKDHNLTQNDLEELHQIAQMVIQSSPGHKVPFYAEKVLKMLLEKQQQELEQTMHVTQFLPSFLEETTQVQPKKIVNRHSSPIKVKPKFKERQPFGDITNHVQKLEFAEQLHSAQKAEKTVNFGENTIVSEKSQNDSSRLTHLSIISHTVKSPEIKPRFPIDANRRNMTWIVFNAEPQEQFVTLLNKLNKPVKVTCLIQNDDQQEFSFSKNFEILLKKTEDDHHLGCDSMDITIGAQCKRDVCIKYRPSKWGETTANLVLKPHGIARDDKKTLKSKVQLKAFHFESFQASIQCNDQPLQNQLAVEEGNLKIRVKNEGTCSIFCKIIQAKSNFQFVLNRGGEKRLKIGLTTELPPELTIFYGPEIARQIFKSTSEGAESSFLKGQDFKGYFEGEQPYKIESSDITHFFRYFFFHFKRFFLGNKCLFFFSRTIYCQTVQIQMNPKKTLRLDQDTIYFSTSNPVGKVKVKNPTHVPCTFNLSHLEPPFKKYHQTVVVKPKYYLSIPISFLPSKPGKFRSLFTLTHVESGKLFTATLIGESN